MASKTNTKERQEDKLFGCALVRTSNHFQLPGAVTNLKRHPPTIPSLLASLHSLHLRIFEFKSGCCTISFNVGLYIVFVWLFLFSLPRPLTAELVLLT